MGLESVVMSEEDVPFRNRSEPSADRPTAHATEFDVERSYEPDEERIRAFVTVFMVTVIAEVGAA